MQKKDNDIPFHKRPIIPDRELLLWEKWIRIREDETTGLGKKLKRPPVDLAMNLLANVREDKERKVALEHAQIEKLTGVRGSLWVRPPRLKQRCYCAPVYDLHRTRAEKGRPTIVEHIGVPAYVREKELGMSGEPRRQSCPQLNADYKMYKEKREYELIEKITKIDPYRPDIDGLLIRGINPPPPPPKLPPLPEIIIEDAKNLPVEPLSGVYALKINKSVLYKDIPGQNLDVLSSFPIQDEDSNEFCTFWTYYFNVPAKRAGRSKLFLQNLGTMTLRYCWKKLKRIIPFIPEDAYEQVFFFNKNEDVISPGQSKEIFFTFIADSPGMYSEYWELSMSNVNLFEHNLTKLVVKLYADAVKDKDVIMKKVAQLKTGIQRKVQNNFVFDFLEEIIEKVFEVVPQFYPYKKFFVEAEMFVMKNPVCFYHQTEVNKMKELYTEMVKGENWDLSIDSWRQKMMAKQFDDRMKYYELLRNSHAELLKPWYEGGNLKKEKLHTVKCLLGQFADLFDKEFARLTDSFMDSPPTAEAGGGGVGGGEPGASAKGVQHSKRGGLPTNASVGSSKTVQHTKMQATHSKITVVINPVTEQMMRNIFYLCIYDHLATTIELCAGVLSSLDLNRWIEFDFCQH